MQKFKLSLLLPCVSHNRHWGACRTSHPLFVKSLATLSPNKPDICLVDYLTDSLNFPKTTAIAVSNLCPCTTSLEKPESVIRFLISLGFSDAQVLSSVKRQPHILLSDIEKNLKPKIAFFRELGLCGPRLGILISRNPSLLCSSLDKSLRPGIEAIKEVLELNGSQNINSSDCLRDLLFRILSRHYWVICSDTRFRYNVAYLRNCGIVGSQLIMLLINERRLFHLGEVELKGLVSRAIEMGFEMGSRMLVHGIMALYGVSPETINKKITLLQTLGFTKDECNEMFVKAPVCLKSSEAKLKRAVAFYIDTVMLDKSVLVGSPFLLGFSMEKRVIPRYKVLEMIKSKKLLKKASLITALILTDKKFVQNYILRFNEDDAKELQVAYEKFLLESSTC